MKEARHLTPAEFQLMEILWRSPTPLSVGRVLKDVRRHRPVAYTTVMTLLDKMARKQSVKRHKHGKAYLYRPLVTREEVLTFLISDFAQSYCRGDQRLLLSHLQTQAPSPEPQSPEQTEEMDVALL